MLIHIKHQVSLCFLLLLSYQSVYSFSVQPKVMPSLHIVAGQLTYSEKINQISKHLTLSYDHELQINSKYPAALSLMGSNLLMPNHHMKIYVKQINKTQTFILIQLSQSDQSLQNSFISLSIGYFLADVTLENFIVIQNYAIVSLQIQQPQIFQKHNFISNQALVKYQQILLFIHHFDVISKKQCFHINFNIQKMYRNYQDIWSTIFVYSNCQMQINQIQYSIISFNSTALQIQHKLTLKFGELEFTVQNQIKHQLLFQPILSSGFIIGISSFLLKNKQKLILQIDLTNKLKINNSNLLSLNLAYLSVSSIVCPQYFPYYNTKINLCVQVCKNGTFLNIQSSQCKSCHNQCLQCQSLYICKTCNQQKKYFLRGDRCIFQSSAIRLLENNNQCLSNVLNCLTCSSSSKCGTCKSGFVIDLISNTCPTCSSKYPNCATCTKTICQTCKSGYVLGSGSTSCVVTTCPLLNCVSCPATSTCSTCVTGYTIQSGACVLNCGANCIQCTSFTVCINCATNYFQNAGNCVLCSNTIQFCLTCSSSTSCDTCMTGYNLDGGGGCTTNPCADANCITCPSYYSCQSCSTGYQIVNGACQAICGDIVVMPQQQCDDGNTVSNDGCSSTCQIQVNFACASSLTSTISQCYYSGPVSITKLYTAKVTGQNVVQVKYSLSPNNLTAWDSVNFTSITTVTSNATIVGYNATRNSDGTVSVFIEYASSLEGQNINVVIDPTSSGIFVLSQVNVLTSSFSISADNNHLLDFYSDDTYKLANAITVLCLVISIMAYIFMLLALISGKMVGIQMMAVIQISFFSLSALSQLNPCFAALANLQFINGYNKLGNNHLDDPLTPIPPKGIFMFSRFADNLNFTLLLLIIPLLVALIAFILSKTIMKENEKTIKVAKKAVGEYFLTVLLFCGYLTGVSFGLQSTFGIKNSTQMLGKISVFESFILLTLLASYFMFTSVKPQYFGEYIKQFKQEKGVSSRYYSFMLIQRLFIGTFLIITNATLYSILIPILIFSGIGCYSLFNKPHKKLYHSYRVLANMLITVLILLIYCIYNNADPITKSNPNNLYLPLIICLLLILCIIYNSIAIVYGIYRYFTQRKMKQQLKKQEAEQLNLFKTNQQTIYQTRVITPMGQSLSPINQIKQHLISPTNNNQNIYLNAPIQQNKSKLQTNNPLKQTNDKNISSLKNIKNQLKKQSITPTNKKQFFQQQPQRQQTQRQQPQRKVSQREQPQKQKAQRKISQRQQPQNKYMSLIDMNQAIQLQQISKYKKI